MRTRRAAVPVGQRPRTRSRAHPGAPATRGTCGPAIRPGPDHDGGRQLVRPRVDLRQQAGVPHHGRQQRRLALAGLDQHMPPGRSQPPAPATTRRATSRPSTRRPAPPAARARAPPAAAGRTHRWARTGRWPAGRRPALAAPPGSGPYRSPSRTRPRRPGCGARSAPRPGRCRRRRAPAPVDPAGERGTERARTATQVDHDRRAAGPPAAACADEELGAPARHEHPRIDAIRRPQNSAQPRTCSSGTPAARRSTMPASSLGRAGAATSSRASSSAKTQPAARSCAATHPSSIDFQALIDPSSAAGHAGICR